MLDFSRFQVLTFDCYGTLINWEEGILGCLHRVLEHHGKDLDEAKMLRLYGDFEARAEQGEYRCYRDVLRSVMRQFGEELAFAVSDDDANSLPESLKNWKPWPDTIEALQKLKNRFRLAIVSNVDDDLFSSTLPSLGVSFDEIITAQQARAYKPSLKMFELALQRVGAPAQQVLHVGQSLYHDVLPARSLGLATVWVNRPSVRSGVGAVKAAAGHPDLQVASLAELVAGIQENS